MHRLKYQICTFIVRRTHAHLKQGTRPSKKVTNVKDVKRYVAVKRKQIAQLISVIIVSEKQVQIRKK